MPRSLNANVETKLADSDGILYPRLLVKLALDAGDGGDVNVWNGYGDLTYNGDTYTGVGNLGKITRVVEPSQLSTPEVEATLNGIPSDLISTALSTNYQGRFCYFYLAFFDSDHSLAGDTYVENVFTGIIDQITPLTVGAAEDTIAVRARSYFAEFENSSVRKWTFADWFSDHDGDLFCNWVARLAERDTVWQET